MDTKGFRFFMTKQWYVWFSILIGFLAILFAGIKFDVDSMMKLVEQYWILGAFLMGFMSSGSLFLPTPSFIVVFLMGAKFNPILLGISAGLGAAVGELIGYYLGMAGHKFTKKYDHELGHVKCLFERYHGQLVIFFFALTPLPFDIVGIFCGVIKYPFRKFFIPTVAGKIIKYTVIAYAGAIGLEVIGHWIGVV
ncbi:MAG: VTT domain-containing protein [Candidatus Micrarchaeota archaeon]